MPAISLTKKERKLVARLQQEGRFRWIYSVPGIVAGAAFVFIYWDAPFAYKEFTSLPHAEMRAIPHYEAVYTVMWLVGMVLLISSIRRLFFERERELLLKITSELYCPDRKESEQASPANHRPFGTSGIASADSASRAEAMPEASGDS